MSKVHVLDASAVLTYLHQEKGQDVIEGILDSGPSWINAVNACEVISKLVEKGMPQQEALGAVDDLGLTIVDFDTEMARLAGFLRARTKSIGASLGDRACLAFAQKTSQTQVIPIVYTAKKSWAKLAWPFKVVLIR